MSFDFHMDETARAMDRAASMPSLNPEPGMWSGTGSLVMQGLAKTARYIDLVGAAPALAIARFNSDYEAIDAYFGGDENTLRGLATRAVDYWTPNPAEVGTAGRIAGSIIPKLAEVIISPGLAVGSEIFGQGEDLIRQGVDAKKALAVGLTQGTGLGLGIWAPIFGTTLTTRALVAGAGVNVTQGIVTKAISQQILKGEKAADQYNPWDLEGLAIDALMGIAFGSLAHLGARAKDAREAMTQADRDAILVAQQARHMEDATAPGRPLDAQSQTAHVQALRTAVDDLVAGRPVHVDQIVQGANFAPDASRAAIATEIREATIAQARQTVIDTIAAEQARTVATETPGFLRSASDLVALKPEAARELAPELQRAVEIAQKPAFQRTAEERLFLKSALEGNAFDALTKPIEPLTRDTASLEQAVRTLAEGAGLKTEAPDPLLAEARQRLIDRPALAEKPVLENPDGTTMSALEATQRARQVEADLHLFSVAASCMIGGL